MPPPAWVGFVPSKLVFDHQSKCNIIGPDFVLKVHFKDSWTAVPLADLNMVLIKKAVDIVIVGHSTLAILVWGTMSHDKLLLSWSVIHCQNVCWVTFLVQLETLYCTVCVPYLFGYKTGLSLSRMSTNNQISPMQFSCYMGFTLPKQSQRSRSVW